MKIEMIDISEIKPYENNAKLHPPEQIKQIEKSIKEFGNNDPITIDENNVIIEGHGRFFALKNQKRKKIPIIRLSHLTEEQKKAYILVHNQLTLNTGFDIQILESEISKLNNMHLSDYGFEDYEDLELEKNNENIGEEQNSEFVQKTIFFHHKQAELVYYAMSQVKNEITETFENSNSNGNEIYEVVKQWAELKKLN